MSTTAYLKSRRFVRRATSGQITNTQWLGGIANAFASIQSSLWVESDILASRLPVNVPTVPDFSGSQYDAFRQSGNAVASSGTQAVFLGMAAYRMAIPSAASGTYVTGVTFRAAADKFCVGGLKVSAVLSNSAAPPVGWDVVRAGGVGDTADATGDFATLGIVDAEDIETAGVLAETALTVSTSVNRAGEFTLDLSSVTTAYSYLYLIVSLFDYEAYRREYWVEGSGLIDGDSIAVTFAADITIPDALYDIRLPLRTLGNAKIAEFKGLNGNLIDSYLRMHWGMRMLIGGLSSSSDTSPIVFDDVVPCLTPQLKLSGLDSIARGALAECYCANMALSGRNLWLRCASAIIGSSPVRVSVFSSVSQPPETSVGTWDGTASTCIGTVLVSGVISGQYVAVPITANATTSRLWISAAIVDIDAADYSASTLGFADYLGFDLTDAHVSRALYPVDDDVGRVWVSAAVVAASGGMIFQALRNDSPTNPSYYAISVDGSAAESGTSYGAWKAWGTTVPTKISSALQRIAESSNFFVALAAGNHVYFAGNISTLSEITFPGTAMIDIVPIGDGFVVALETGACVVLGSANHILREIPIESWTGCNQLRANTTQVVAITSSGGILCSGFDAASTSTLQGLTGVMDLRISDTRIAVLKTDLTCVAYTISGTAISPITLSGWTSIVSIAATANAVWACNGTEILSAGYPWATNFYNPGDIPSGHLPYFLVGSNAMRMAVSYYPEV